MRQIVALFGEAEKGAFQTPHRVNKLPQLLNLLGNPPPDSQGIAFAIQTILYDRDLIFFRVQEEGFSLPDYRFGLKYLATQTTKLHALCLPGVGDPHILLATKKLCLHQKIILLTQQNDLYDYLTSNH